MIHINVVFIFRQEDYVATEAEFQELKDSIRLETDLRNASMTEHMAGRLVSIRTPTFEVPFQIINVLMIKILELHCCFIRYRMAATLGVDRKVSAEKNTRARLLRFLKLW